MGRGSSKASSGGGTSESALSAQSVKWYNSLSSDEKDAIISMQYSTQSLNEYLSGRRKDFNEATKDRLQEQADNIDSALSKFNTTSEVVTYRGVSASEFTNTYLGLDAETKGIKSTSYDPKRADSFAQNQGGFVIEYHIAPGRHGADVNGVPGASEREFLIRNGMKQKVQKKEGNKLIVNIG